MKTPKKISEGAEADIYESKLFGTRCIIKQRRCKSYIPKELDESLRERRTRTEARAIIRAAHAGIPVPRLLMVGVDSIWMGAIKGDTFQGKKEIPQNAQRVFGDLLGKLHNADISHGDFTKANLMSDKTGKIFVIDFGLANITDSYEEKALDLLLLKRSLGKDFGGAIKAYKKTAVSYIEVCARLSEIELRGRYQERTMAAEKDEE